MGSLIPLTSNTAGSGAWANVSSFDVPNNGMIVGVYWNAQADLDTDGDTAIGLVSFSSSAAAPATDNRSLISYIALTFQVVTSGGVIPAYNWYHDLPDIPVAAGERIYLHQFATSGVTPAWLCALAFSFNTSLPAARR